MDQLFSELFDGPSLIAQVTPYQLILALLSSAVLNGLLAKLYAHTHGGYSYSKSFLHAIVLVGLTVALIMVIIGSDIARAFALVGAMSIVRFRTPVKDTRDLVFLFAAIAIGMACGTRFYLFAAIFTVFMVALVWGFHVFGFGDLPNTGFVLKMQMKPEDRDRVTDLCNQLCDHCSIVSISRLSETADREKIIYEVELKKGVQYTELIERLSQAVAPLSIVVLVGESRVNV